MKNKNVVGTRRKKNVSKTKHASGGGRYLWPERPRRTRPERKSFYDSSALTPSKGEYLAEDDDDEDVAAAAAECGQLGGDWRFWYLVADLPSSSGDGSDSADDEPPVPAGDRAGL